MRPNRVAVAAALLVLSMVASACTSASGSETASGDGGDAATGASFDVSLTDELKLVPEMIEAPAGTPLTFNVTNEGATQHSFAVRAGGQTYETPQLNGGETAVLEVPALEPGDYETVCTAPGHEQAGMVGMLMVSDTGGTDGGSDTGGDAGSMPTMNAEEMAAADKAKVDAFVAQLEEGPNTEGLGNQPLKPTIDGGVKVFELTVSQIKWETTTGTFVDAMAFNGMVPGPQITVNPGDRVRFFVRNQMDQPFGLHFHGLTVPNDQDGVPNITQPPIMPGESWSYEFTIKDPPGFYVYHSHFNAHEQVNAGLYGALLVVPKTGWSAAYGVDPDVEATMFVGDGTLGFNVNGKGFPSTLPIIADKGDWVLIHMANDAELLHPMHLHGFHFKVVGVDGYPLSPANQYMADTLVIAPGSRYDVLVKADYPGVWAFHCHILSHVDTSEGMFGMVTAMIVN